MFDLHVNGPLLRGHCGLHALWTRQLGAFDWCSGLPSPPKWVLRSSSSPAPAVTSVGRAPILHTSNHKYSPTYHTILAHSFTARTLHSTTHSLPCYLICPSTSSSPAPTIQFLIQGPPNLNVCCQPKLMTLRSLYRSTFLPSRPPMRPRAAP